MSALVAIASLVASLAPAQSTREPVGELLIISSVQGAEVVIDGVVVGTTPLAVLELPEGQHRVRMTAPGTEPFVTDVSVRAGRLQRLEVRLVPQAIWAPIAVGEPGIETGRKGHTPLITRWYFWGIVAAVGAAIVITGVQLSAGSDFVPGGELGSTDTSDWTRF